MISRRIFLAATLSAVLNSACSRSDGELNVLIWTDSTGNGDIHPREWPYLWADMLAGAGAAVQVASWSVEAGRYGIVTRADTEPAAIQVRNFAVPGSTFAYPTGAIWGSAFSFRPDVVIIALGLNHAKNLDRRVIFGEILVGLERFISAYPDVPIVYVKQSPFRDDDDMEVVYEVVDQLTLPYDLQIVDVAAAFEALQKDRSLYLDGDDVHPSQEGQRLYAEAVQASWPPRMKINRPSRPRLMNLLSNPRFEFDDDGEVAGWTAGGVGTLSLEKEARDLKVTCDGGYGYLYQDISPEHLNEIRGQALSFAVDMGLDANAADGQGRISVTITTASGQETIQTRASLPPGGMRGWRAICDILVPNDVMSFRVAIFHDQAPTPSRAPLRLRRSMVVNSSFPQLT